MSVTRREFLELCRNSAVGAALGTISMSLLEQRIFASSSAPTILWMQSAACSGCSMSLLNRNSTTAPTNIADLLINEVNLRYHTTLMALAGDSAVAVTEDAMAQGSYILAVEGGIPTAFGGAAGFAWTRNGKDVTLQTAITNLASRATAVLAVGTCASFGGVSSKGANPAGIKPVSAVIGKPTINIAGCPPHPDWIVYVIAQLLLNSNLPLDQYGRPTALYGKTVHSQCPRRDGEDASAYGQDHYCYREMGCLGPSTQAGCPTVGWNGNGSTGFCTEVNSQCLGCTGVNFPASPIRHSAN